MTATQRLGTGVSAEFWDGAAGSDPTAWHNNLDSFGSQKAIGTADNFAFPVYTNNIERYRVSEGGEFYFGDSVPIVGLEAGVDAKYQYTVDSTERGAMVLYNPNAGITAYCTISVCNLNGLGAALLAIGSGWDGSVQANLVPGDAGLFYDTIKAQDPAGDAGLVICNGVGPVKFMTSYPNVERMRLTPAGVFCYGANGALAAEKFRVVGAANFDTSIAVGSALAAGQLGVNISYAGFALVLAQNQSNGAAATAGFAGMNDASHTVELFMTSTGYTPATGWEADSAILDTASNLILVTQGVKAIKFKTNGANTRYQIDGDGKMAWFGATTVAQQTAVADAAGGGNVDAEARTAINDLLSRLRNYALIAT